MHHAQLLHTRAWRPLRGCPGRHVRDGADEELDHLVRTTGQPAPSARAADPVWITFLAGGGALLSYVRADGTVVHTLNTPDGLARKCAALGVDLGALGSIAHVEVDEPFDVVVEAVGDRRQVIGLLRAWRPELPMSEAAVVADRPPIHLPVRATLPEARAVVDEVTRCGGRARLVTAT